MGKTHEIIPNTAARQSRQTEALKPKRLLHPLPIRTGLLQLFLYTLNLRVLLWVCSANASKQSDSKKKEKKSGSSFAAASRLKNTRSGCSAELVLKMQQHINAFLWSNLHFLTADARGGKQICLFVWPDKTDSVSETVKYVHSLSTVCHF